VAPLFGQRGAESERSHGLLIAGRHLTEEQARAQAEALAIGMGITFYVVRNRDDDFLAVRLPPDDCEVLATIDPPRDKHDHKLE
jgi:hypothetical protein